MTTAPQDSETHPRAPAAPASGSRDSTARNSRAVLAGGAVLLFVVAALGSFLLTRGDAREEGKAGTANTLSGPAGARYTMSQDPNWQRLTGGALEGQPGRPLSVLRRKDGKGLIAVRREGRAPRSFRTFTKQLDSEFERRIPDFRKRSSRTLRIKAGDAFFYSYIRERRGTVHSVVLVPAGTGSYVLNSLVQGGEPDAARELGRMILSFDA